MADPTPAESSFPSDIFGLKRISNSFPNVSGLFVGFPKAPPEPDSLRSPTSILDFRFLSSLSNSFKLRSPRSASYNGSQRRWEFGEMGLGMINVLANEEEPSGEISCLQRKDIIFGLRTNRNAHYLSRDGGGYTPKSKSLPRNFRVLPQAPELGSEESFAVRIESGALGNFSSYPLNSRSLSMLSRSNQNRERDSGKFCFDDFTANTSIAPVADGDFSLPQPLAADLRLLPVTINQSDGSARPLSAKEIELSEDYTCIISYGPNSKITHIFGDCILDCHSNNLCNATKDDEGAEMPHKVDCEGAAAPHPSDQSFSLCLLCEKKLGDEEENRECETAVQTRDCMSKEIVGELLEKIQDSPNEDLSSSCNSDSLFTFGMPFAI
ncbi:hypothetical protein MLD38_030697 [Melastoma candidum]|uniref:Uncharacterized protein n=1 Tax=Melastoma candidum TaxID=119954 RepID=A0ACB9MM51_9MYRT|nr:hypothetical protein MLD38_030697 [Melastoma candidum]